MRKSVITVLAALALSGMGAAPAAAAAEDEVSVSVDFAGLDLTTSAGNAMLNRRVDAAIKDVCAKPDIRNLKAMTAWEECKASARIGALDQLSIFSPFESVELVSAF